MPRKVSIFQSEGSRIKPRESRLHTPPNFESKHELRILLGGNSPPSSGTEDKFLESIRKAVAAFKDEIDVVSIEGEPYGPELWTALSGLQPVHLELTEGQVNEYCDYGNLQHVSPPWSSLKSVYIGAYNGDGGFFYPHDIPTHSFPPCYAHIKTLVLNYPSAYQLYFYPEGGATDLRSLTILWNSALVTFANTVACNPRLKDTLRSLTIAGHQSYSAQGREGVKRAHTFLREAKVLSQLELVLNDHESGSGEKATYSLQEAASAFWQSAPDSDESQSDSENDDKSINVDEAEPPRTYSAPYAGLHSTLPRTLTALSFQGPANGIMLREINQWIEKARDKTWLPSLRRLSFKLDLPNRITEEKLTAAQSQELQRKVQEFLKIMSERQLGDGRLKVVDPRDVKELQYPLAISS